MSLCLVDVLMTLFSAMCPPGAATITAAASTVATDMHNPRWHYRYRYQRIYSRCFWYSVFHTESHTNKFIQWTKCCQNSLCPPQYMQCLLDTAAQVSVALSASDDNKTCHMMTSSNGHIFRDTGPLCGESTGYQWIPLTKPSEEELWCFLWSTSEQMVEYTIERPVIWNAIAPIMMSLSWVCPHFSSCGYQFRVGVPCSPQEFSSRSHL